MNSSILIIDVKRLKTRLLIDKYLLASKIFTREDLLHDIFRVLINY